MTLWGPHFTDEHIEVKIGTAICKSPQLWPRSVRLKCAWEIREASQRRQLFNWDLEGRLGDGQGGKREGWGEKTAFRLIGTNQRAAMFRNGEEWLLPLPPSHCPGPQGAHPWYRIFKGYSYQPGLLRLLRSDVILAGWCDKSMCFGTKPTWV